MAHQITHPTGKPEGLSLAVLRLDAEPVAYRTLRRQAPKQSAVRRVRGQPIVGTGDAFSG